MAKKWHSSFVSFAPARPEAAETQAAPAPAQTVAGIAALMDSGQPPPAPAGPFASSGHIYEFAGMRTPANRPFRTLSGTPSAATARRMPRETAKRRQFSEFDLAKAGGNRQLRAELSGWETRTGGNAAEMLRERECFFLWLRQKRREEQIFAEAVSYFVTENPITACPAEPDGEAAKSAAPAPSEAPSPNPAENAG